MPKRSPHPYISWRNGRPRYTPSPQLRSVGEIPRDLKHPDGTWYSLGEAVDHSRQLLARLQPAPHIVRRKPPRAVPRQRQHTALTVGKMVELWQSQSFDWTQGPPKGLAARTRRDYKQKLRAFELDFWEVWTSPADAVQPHHMQGAYDEMEQSRGVGTARGALVVLGRAFKWAITRGHLRGIANPCSGLEKHLPQPRVRYGTVEEMKHLIATADSLGRFDIGDAISMGLWTGQRECDRLELVHHGKRQFRRAFRQSKTGAIVEIREAPALEARLAAAKERRQAANIVNARVLLNERSWIAWSGDYYRHKFAEVRDAAAKTMPSLQGFHDQDLRDTAVTWMALAESTVPEIAAVTGHSIKTVHDVLKHYLASHPQMADSAIGKMVTWYDKGGDTEG